MEINRYKANIYTYFTILSFHRPTTHNPLKSTATLAPRPTLPKPHYPSKNAITLAIWTLCWFRILAKLWAFNFGHPCPSLVKGEVLSPEKIRATTGGIASLLSLALHQPFQNRTIPHAFRRVRVCVCLVGFASLQSPWAHTLKASLPCLPLPLHRPSPFLQPLQKNIYHLPCSLDFKLKVC